LGNFATGARRALQFSGLLQSLLTPADKSAPTKARSRPFGFAQGAAFGGWSRVGGGRLRAFVAAISIAGRLCNFRPSLTDIPPPGYNAALVVINGLSGYADNVQVRSIRYIR
jgi:hypothetical protein